MLLLSNGKVVRGEIVEDAAAGVYRLQQSGGTVPYPRSMVLKAAGSVEELYQFQVARLPVGDPDERMKLARWCLTEHLPAQAREQLRPSRRCARATPRSGGCSSTSTPPPTAPGVDPEVRRTSGEARRAARQPRPPGRQQAKSGSTPCPVIFDLPPAQAVKRANEFAEYVQPVLLQSCVKCHNEKYQGAFQLVEIKNSATEEPRHRPGQPRRHAPAGQPRRPDPERAPLGRPGPARRQQERHLPRARTTGLTASSSPGSRASGPPRRRPAPADADTRTGSAARARPGDGFATDRSGRAALGPSPPPRPPGRSPASQPLNAAPGRQPAAPVPAGPPTSSRKTPTSRSSPATPGFPGPLRRRGRPADPPVAPLPPPPRPQAAAPEPPAPRRPSHPRRPRRRRGRTHRRPQPAPRDGPAALPDLAAGGPPGPPATKKAKPKIDNALLEKMMKNRNATP